MWWHGIINLFLYEVAVHILKLYRFFRVYKNSIKILNWEKYNRLKNKIQYF
jgi:hypothetical protein